MDTSNSLPLPVTGLASDAAAPPTPATSDPTAAHKTAQDFEAFFLSQTFENMFSGIKGDAMFGGGSAETVYRSLLLQEYSKVAASNGGVGIADAVQREILRAQEKK
jgi:Rod binding domain-containing protein